MKMSAVPDAVNSASVMAYMSARRLKLSVNSKMQAFPRGVTGKGSK